MNQQMQGCPWCGQPATFEPFENCPGWRRMTLRHKDCFSKKETEQFPLPEEVAERWNRRAPDARDARIAELEEELIAEAKKTAAEKTRADQLAEQHRMQANMHSQAREELAQLRAQREPAFPAVERPKDFKAWPGGQEPEDTAGATVWVQLRNGVMDEGLADSFDWEHDDHPYDIVAYKVVKP